MTYQGRAHKFGDNINTDYIIPAKRKRDSLNMEELSKYLLEDLDSNLVSRIQKEDFLVGGWNFGCGSSREVAPLVILNSGISAVVAKSFARIFYRNAIAVGLTIFECDTDNIDDGDQLKLIIDQGKLVNMSKDEIYQGKELPRIMIDILEYGGLVNYIKERGDFIL